MINEALMQSAVGKGVRGIVDREGSSLEEPQFYKAFPLHGLIEVIEFNNMLH